MIKNLIDLKELFKSGDFNFMKSRFKDVFQNYNFYYISQNSTIRITEKHNINQNIANSKVIIIDQSNDLNKKMEAIHLIISFEQTLILLEQSSLAFLYDILTTNSQLSVCFLSNTRDFLHDLKNPEIEFDSIFEEEIEALEQNLILYTKSKDIKLFWSFIVPSISGYLIKKSYLKQKNQRITQFILNLQNDDLSPSYITEDEYVELRYIDNGSIFLCTLILIISQCELYAIKKSKKNDIESLKLAKISFFF